MWTGALRLLGLEPEDKQKTVDYLYRCQRDDGGFSKGMGEYRKYDDRGVARLDDAYYAVKGLQSLDEMIPNALLLSQWVLGSQNPDGGFGRGRHMCPSEMPATMRALVVLDACGIDVKNMHSGHNVETENIIEDLGMPYVCEQVDPCNPGEVRYLKRIALPIRKKQLMEWVGNNLVFSSNYTHSGALTIIDGYGACGPKARAYVSLANAAGIRSRMIYLKGHCASESLIDGRWTVIDPMFYDYARDGGGRPVSAAYVREHRADDSHTHFGDWRYERLEVENPDGSAWKFGVDGERAEAIKAGIYSTTSI